MAQHRIVGMDPYIEAQAWGDFHMNFIVEVRDALVPVLVPKYIARIEVRTYIDEDCEAPPVRYPDVMPIGASSAACNDATEHPQCALTPSPSPARGRGEQGVRANVASEIPMGITKESAQIGAPYKQGGIAVAAKPILRTVPLLVEHRERFIEIYTRADRQLVTVIELLSPSNKRPNSAGRREYLEKRRQLFQARVNLVEIDLVLQGERMPTNEPLPEADYYALVARRYRLPVVEIYPWKLGEPMPTIPVPLLREDPDALLNLQEVYEQVYARARYDLQLDFSKPLPESVSP